MGKQLPSFSAESKNHFTEAEIRRVYELLGIDSEMKRQQIVRDISYPSDYRDVPHFGLGHHTTPTSPKLTHSTGSSQIID